MIFFLVSYYQTNYVADVPIVPHQEPEPHAVITNPAEGLESTEKHRTIDPQPQNNLQQLPSQFQDGLKLNSLMHSSETENINLPGKVDAQVSRTQQPSSATLIPKEPPLLIVGVAEPTIYMYTVLYKIAKGSSSLGGHLFIAWAGWVCVWTAIFLFLLAIFNAGNIISRFTRIADELFGMLISRTARSWRYGTGLFRNVVADYGVPLMAIAWTSLSYAIPAKVPSGVPRRLYCPLPWDSESLYHWTVIKDMGKVHVEYIFVAIIPAIMVAGLYFFDHSVASQMAQQKEFNLKKPSAYHYDIFVLGVTTLICGLLGLPPSNGVLL
ncbi:hypothetical protein POM88_025282 [Heracleum sosnowskyi]|uniref:Bicarbonate transporter-like transmembrane domain-containing protein n=1 Tax=Heracleum sosnowskyi TaxID=360622 RepID=A0AAD8I630_9APIA|nr:hypothetical protein POM88_025282 [Heracleum sosnowskyi]